MTDPTPTQDGSSSAPAAPAAEATFRGYSKEQGKKYAQHRQDYHPKFYKLLLDQHTATGGQFDLLLDIGCGPGIAVRALAPHFAHAIGLDPSEGMIATARSTDEGLTSTSEPIRFDVSTAEELGSGISPPVPEGSVDLLVAATAAHWFDMAGFWPRAAKVLKPGGTVAIWCAGSIRADPSLPNPKAFQAAVDQLDEDIKEFMAPGNILTRDLYKGLPLPWTLPEPVPEFDETTFFRREWGTADPTSEPMNEYHSQSVPLTLNLLEMVIGTASPVTRWRAANPELAGTESDPAKKFRRNIEKALAEGGIPESDMRGGADAVLIMVKKKADTS